MWIYVPGISTSSACAQADSDSISASNWQFQALEASCLWRGKLSPARNWFQRWKRVSCIQLLCGAMSEPSTAAHGVAAWMASLAESRVRLIPSQERSAAASTSATSGLPLDASSFKRAHGLSSSRMSPACSRRGMTKSLAPKGYGETFKSWVLRLRGGLFTASEVGASHERERIFILGVADRYSGNDPGSGIWWEGWRGQSSDGGGQVPGVGQADACDAGLQRSEQPGPLGERHRSEAHGSVAELRRAHVADVADTDIGIGKQHARSRDDTGDGAASDRERPYAEPSGSSRIVVDAVSGGHDGGADDHVRRSIERNAAEGSGGPDIGSMANPAVERGGELPIRSWRQDQADANADRPSLFPPGPAYLDAWREIIARAPELEPAVRRVADGMASRVDSLRMLGNGVVPLQAAYAIRTLATRLAGRGSAGATRLVRLMDLET